MEHVRGGDLSEHLENHGGLAGRPARTAFGQAVWALRFCHQRGSAPRDLKPDNILVDGDLTVKLADFGFCREVGDEKLSALCGPGAPAAGAERRAAAERTCGGSG